MNSINHFKQNRTVHLARRDVYFRCAAELILEEHAGYSAQESAQLYEETLFLLRIARRHAQFSIRESGKNENDEQFARFIRLLTGNVKAALSMLNLKSMVDSPDDTLFSFMGVNRASIALQAEEYQRRANDIIRSLQKTLLLAKDSFIHLRVENDDSATPEERERYGKARDHFLEIIKEGRHKRNLYRHRGVLRL